MGILLAGALSTLVFCAPGYPGAAGDAQPYVDQFASAAAEQAGWPKGSLGAVYDPTEQGGLAKLADAQAVLAFVPYPFFVQHSKELGLTPLAEADVTNTGPTQHWSLVAKSGQFSGPAVLTGFTLASTAGYAPDFVRHAALASLQLPADLKIEPAGQVLGVLRRVASGERVVALLDETQTKALPTLPFSAELKSVAQSPALPVALIVTVGSRLPAQKAKAFQQALLKMGQGSQSDAALGSLQLKGFVAPRLPADVGTP